MTADQIGKAIRDALVASSTIGAACLSKYQTKHTVYYCPPITLSPTEAECPVFVVIVQGKNVADLSDVREFQFTVGCVVRQEDVSDSMTGGVRHLSYQGLSDVEDLMDMVITAVSGVSRNLSFATVEMRFEQADFPLFSGAVDFVATYPHLLGAELSL